MNINCCGNKWPRMINRWKQVGFYHLWILYLCLQLTLVVCDDVANKISANAFSFLSIVPNETTIHSMLNYDPSPETESSVLNFLNAVTSEITTEVEENDANYPTKENEQNKSESHKGNKEDYEVCRSPTCFEAAKFYTSAMDQTVDPCQDFFKFSCGGWLKNNKIPAGRSIWGVTNVMNQEIEDRTIEELNSPISNSDSGTIPYVKRFYQSCLATENVEKEVCVSSILKGLQSVGGFPAVDLGTFNSSWTRTRRLASLVREFGFSYIIDLDVKEFNRHHIIHIKPVIRFGLDRASLFLPKNYTTKVDAYKTFIKKTICFLKNGCGNETKIDEVIDDIIKFESDLVKTVRENIKEDNENVDYYRKSLSRFSSNVPIINWEEYINYVFEDADIEVTAKTKIAVKKEKHLYRIGHVLQKASDETVANYLGWRFIQMIGPVSCSYLKKYNFEFQRKTLNIATSVSYPKQCYLLTKKYFDLAVGRIYVQKHFSKQTMDDMVDMLRTITTAFKKLLSQNTWMDNATKAKASRKMDLMQNNIGYPFWIMNEQKLNKFYPVPNREFDNSEFVGSMQALMKFRTNEAIDKLTKAPCDTERWLNNPAEVNAFYSSYINTIKFPAGYLMVPNYWPNVISAINYGGIGNTIGHEITHGFDNRGRLYDGYGNFQNWWSNQTMKEFLERQSCIEKQYSSTVDPTVKLTLQGNLTLADDIADNGGVRQSYAGYLLSDPKDERLPGLEQFSAKQLFFIALGGTYCTSYKPHLLEYKIRTSKHTPDMYRVNIPLMNFDVFSEVFQCPKGSPMNPPSRCVLW